MSEGHKVKAVLFGSLANGGHLQRSVFVDYPGVSMEAVKESRDHPWKRAFYFGDDEFSTADAAVEAWKKVNP